MSPHAMCRHQFSAPALFAATSSQHHQVPLQPVAFFCSVGILTCVMRLKQCKTREVPIDLLLMQGLGKTLQTIAFLAFMQVRQLLVSQFRQQSACCHLCIVLLEKYPYIRHCTIVLLPDPCTIVFLFAPFADFPVYDCSESREW